MGQSESLELPMGDTMVTQSNTLTQCSLNLLFESFIIVSYQGSEPFWALSNFFMNQSNELKIRLPEYLITITPWYQFYLETFSVWFERSWCFNKVDLIKKKYMVQYALYRVIHCALGTDSLCPTPPLGHSKSLLIFQTNLSHENSSHGSKTKCSLFIHNNHTHVFTKKWITTLQITRNNKHNVFFIHCAPSPPK